MNSENISSIIEEKTIAIAEAVVDRQYKLQPDIWEAYGEKGRELSVRDVTLHLPYLCEAVRASDSSSLVNYVLWLKELFRGLNLPENALTVNLECLRDVLQEMLEPEMAVITTEYIEVGLNALGVSTAEQESFIPGDAPFSDLAKSYLNALLKGDRSHASRLIEDALEKGASVKEIYLHVFQATQYEIGRLWHTKQVSVAQEHYCSAATERIMSQLYSRIFSTDRIGHTYVGACVGGELHQIGARMVADFFEMDGWDTYYMGANTPEESILQAVKEYQANVVGLSMSVYFHRSTLTDLIRAIRSSAEAPKGLRIVVGGYSFINKPELWKEVGADGMAMNAADAISLANQLTKEV